MTDQNRSLYDQMKANGLLEDSSHQLIVANLDASVVPMVNSAEAIDLDTEDPIIMLLVLDKSISMASETSNVQQGLRNLVEMGKRLYQKHGTEIILGVITFGVAGNIQPLIPFTKVDDIDPQWISKYDPADNGTALLDGTFFGLAGMGGFGYSLWGEGVRGGKRIFVVLTDGGENDSRKADEAAVSQLMTDLRIPKQTSFGLIGAGPTSWYEPIGVRMGFKRQNIITVQAGPGSFARAFEIVSNSMELHSVAQSTGQTVDADDGDILIPTNIITDDEAEDDIFS